MQTLLCFFASNNKKMSLGVEQLFELQTVPFLLLTIKMIIKYRLIRLCSEFSSICNILCVILNV